MAFLLLPFAWIYAGIMAFRNWLYDRGWKPAETFAVPLLNVGNLRVGGTGKTPHVIWLVEELLRQGHRPAILSRGYGRRTRGPRLAGPADSAATVGDEPWQYVGHFAAAGVPVAVAEARRLGVRLLLAAHPDVTVVVLDDAYQHRAVRPALNILLTELARPFYHDYVLPAGRLRESRAGAARADVVILTKCPVDLTDAVRAEAIRQIGRYARPAVPVLFSGYEYASPQLLTEFALQAPSLIPAETRAANPAEDSTRALPITAALAAVSGMKLVPVQKPNATTEAGTTEPVSEAAGVGSVTGAAHEAGAATQTFGGPVAGMNLPPPKMGVSGPALLLTGIAQPGPLRAHLEQQGCQVVFHGEFPDHHAFTAADLAGLRAHWQPGWPIFTTEKDATRLLDPALGGARAGLPIYTIAVRVAFAGDGAGQLRRLLPAAPRSGR